jgi:hypothetical protein
MVNQQERARLMEAYKDTPVYAAGLVIKCAVCLFLIGVVAVIGVQSDLAYDPERMQTQQRQDRQRVVTVSVNCQDAAARASAQVPATIKVVTVAAAETPHKPYVPEPGVATKGC